MKPNDEVVYTISITGITKLADQNAIVTALPNHIGGGKMAIIPVTQTAPGLIEVPRLFTTWRGDASEQAWQQSVMKAVMEHGASCAIDVQPWSHAPGYPQGDTEL